jgi:hypothetical protein
MVWTDGYIDSPRAPVAPVVTKCPACGRWFSIDEAPQLSDDGALQERGEIARIEFEDAYGSEAYVEALSYPWVRETEIALRLRLLWHENHPRRVRPAVSGSIAEPLTPVQQENLESLVPLLDDDRLLLRAEALRELGLFDAAVRTVESVVPIDEYDAAPEVAAVIRWEARQGNTLPAVVRKVPSFSPRLSLGGPELSFPSEFDYPVDDECTTVPDVMSAIRGGFYPLPYTEDLFAFPSEDKEELFSTIVAMRLEAPKSGAAEGEGWLPFMEEDYTLCYRYGRLFTEGEREQFDALRPGAKERLRAFWSIKSYDLPADEEVRDHYFRDLYYLFWHGPGALPEEDACVRHEEFAEIWIALLDEKYLLGRPFNDWFELNRSRIYWDVYWRVLAAKAEPQELLGLIEIENAMMGDVTYLYGIRRKRMDLVERQPSLIVQDSSPSELLLLLLDSGHHAPPRARPVELRLNRESGRIAQRQE